MFLQCHFINVHTCSIKDPNVTVFVIAIRKSLVLSRTLMRARDRTQVIDDPKYLEGREETLTL